MEIYDKRKQIKRLTDVMGLQRAFRLDIETATKNSALSGTCDEFVTKAIHCVLCDMPQEAKNLLAKAKAWLERAIEMREWEAQSNGAVNKSQRRLYAIIRWLHDGIHDQGTLANWLVDVIKWFRVDHPELVATSELGLTAITFIDAGGFHDYLSLAAPGGIDTVKCSGANEKQMALTLAAQALTQKFPEEKVQASVKKFLDRQVGEWLNNGHAIRAAEWMKVIYWQRGETGLSPLDAVRKCLDHVEH
jgi:hypothetical protein